MERTLRPLAILLLSFSFFVTLIGCGSSSVGGGGNGSPTLTFSASSTSIASGQSVTLNWQAANANSVTITANAGGTTRTVVNSSQLTGSANDSPTQTTVYTAVATGASGAATSPQSVTVNVAQAVQPQITSFAANPPEIGGGQNTTISWATTNATSVNITPPVFDPEDGVTLPTTGSATVPVSTTTTYTITASGPGGNSAPQTLTVKVPFTVSLSVTPATISAGQSATFSWQITGGAATALTIDNGICASCPLPQGSTTVTPAATTSYTATATAADGTQIKQTVTATVGSQAAGAIKHIFFMLQENRSFDMYLGQLGPYRANRLAQLGIADAQTVNGFDPNVTLQNHHTGVHVKPFHQATVCTENLTPSWDESHHDVALTGGDGAWNTTTSFTDASFAMNNFLDTTGSVTQNFDPNGTRAMGFYNQQDLPYYYDLATFFATSDSWHSPILANTYPNRFYLMSGTSFGHVLPDGQATHPKYAAKTIFRAMNDANVSWLYYHADQGIFLGQFQDFADPAVSGKTFPVSDLFSRLGGSCSGTPCDPDKALPEVIFIDSASSTGLDEHPDANIQKGAALVQSIIAALMNSPAWKDSVFILSYDEGGGLYDHVPPFSVPLPDNIPPGQCPDPNNGSAGYCRLGKLGGTFNLTGLRVPVIVISPFAKPHYVSHVPRDYTAILAFIEKTFNVPALTARDAFFQDQSRDMTEFFDFSTPNLLNAPNGGPWTQFLPTQPTSGVCDQTKEAGPTF
jgi:phospholipase C